MDCPCCGFSSETVFCRKCVSSSFKKNVKRINEVLEEINAKEKVLQGRLRADTKDFSHESLVKELRENVENYKWVVSEYRKKIEIDSDSLKRGREILGRRKKRLRLIRARTVGLQGFSLKEQPDLSNPILRSLEARCFKSMKRLSKTRKNLIYQLVDLFPIDIDKNPETIAGLPLPSDMTHLRELPEDSRNAVLGIFCRILLIVSSYLSLVLPFKIWFIESQPAIGRWGADGLPTMLLGTGLSLESGMIMLRKNLEACCFFQGIPVELVKDWNLVNGLWQLLHSPSLGKPVYRSLLEGDSRIARVPVGKSLKDRSALAASIHATAMGDGSPKSDESVHVVSTQPVVRKRFLKTTTRTDSGKGRSSVDNLESILTESVLSYGSDDSDFEENEWDFLERPQPPRPSTDEDILLWLSSGAGS